MIPCAENTRENIFDLGGKCFPYDREIVMAGKRDDPYGLWTDSGLLRSTLRTAQLVSIDVQPPNSNGIIPSPSLLGTSSGRKWQRPIPLGHVLIKYHIEYSTALFVLHPNRFDVLCGSPRNLSVDISFGSWPLLAPVRCASATLWKISNS